MNEILEIIKSQMLTLNIDYSYLYNNAPNVTYPYVTGEYTQYDYSYEDNSNHGDMILECWNRDSISNLVTLHQTIKNHFRNLHASQGSVVANISYNSANTIRTGEQGLYKIEIHLDIVYWEGQ